MLDQLILWALRAHFNRSRKEYEDSTMSIIEYSGTFFIVQGLVKDPSQQKKAQLFEAEGALLEAMLGLDFIQPKNS